VRAEAAITLALLLACGAEDGTPSGAESPAPAAAVATAGPIPAELIGSTWPTRMADDATRAPYEGHAGWTALFTRRTDAALGAFSGGEDPAALARVHTTYAAFYQQAALLAANSTWGVYSHDHQAADPAEVTVLVAAAAGLRGDCDALKEALAVEAPAAVAAQAAAWKAASCPGVEIDPEPFPSDDAERAAGAAPTVGALPHYRFTEQTEDGREVAAADPTSLLLLARWHEKAARDLAPDAGPVIDQLLAPWRITPPSAPAQTQQMSDDWLFAGFLLAPSDAAFLSDVRRAEGPDAGTAAVSAWSERSPLAAAVAPALSDGKVDVDRVLDNAAAVRRQITAEMERVSGGEAGFHRPFADIAGLATLRAGMMVADAADQYRDAGILRLNTLERATGPLADPVFAISVAAWDAGNRNPLRGQELVHQLLPRFPALEAARYPLDAMHIRLSRNSVDRPPVH